MSDYREVERSMAAGTPPELICAVCPWDRLCVSPPSMTKAEIDEHIKKAEAEDRVRDPEGKGLPQGMLLTAITLGGRDKSGELCPAFALRLRSSDGRELSDQIRTIMRGES